MVRNDYYQGVYRDPKTSKLLVKIFSFKDVDSGDFNPLRISSVLEKLASAFGITISITPIKDKYFNREVDDPVVAYTDIEAIIELASNGDEIDMSVFDAVAEEFAYNDDYQEFLHNRFMELKYKDLDKEFTLKVYNYIADKAVSLLNYNLEMVNKNWKKWNEDPNNQYIMNKNKA